MSKNMDTAIVSAASGVTGGAVAYASAVNSMGIFSFCLWKLGIPMVALMSGPVIVATAVGAAVVGGGAYCVGKAIVSHKANLEDVAHKNDFKDGPQ